MSKILRKYYDPKQNNSINHAVAHSKGLHDGERGFFINPTTWQDRATKAAYLGGHRAGVKRRWNNAE